MEQLPSIIHESWHQYLQPLFNDPKMAMIKAILFGQERVYFHPQKEDIFKVFRMPIHQIKVCILGQDPYDSGAGVGLAFAVNSASPMPPSLRIIKGEIENKETLWYFKKYHDAMWKTLEHWEEQGVFLLNTALTVEHKNAGSHLGIWQWFTSRVIKGISIVQKPIWLLWGSKAQGFKDYMNGGFVIKNKEQLENLNHSNSRHNFILEAHHPAAETYPNSKYRFTGCNHFNLANEILKAKGLEQIKW